MDNEKDRGFSASDVEAITTAIERVGGYAKIVLQDPLTGKQGEWDHVRNRTELSVVKSEFGGNIGRFPDARVLVMVFKSSSNPVPL